MSPRHKPKNLSDSEPDSDSSNDYDGKKKYKDKKDKKGKDKKDKKDKKKKDQKGDSDDDNNKAYSQNFGGFSDLPTGHQATHSDHYRQQQQPHGSSFPQPGVPSFPSNRPQQQPNPNTPPPSGYRIPLTTDGLFPLAHQLGPVPCKDLDGSPVYIGSAIFRDPPSVHPCKIGSHLQPTPCVVPLRGHEYSHTGRYDLLPFDPQTMEWVRTSHGRLPPGRRPIEGGYEADGNKLYHARGDVASVIVPGKAGEHLRGCNVPFGGGEHTITENYEILCWR